MAKRSSGKAASNRSTGSRFQLEKMTAFRKIFQLNSIAFCRRAMTASCCSITGDAAQCGKFHGGRVIFPAACTCFERRQEGCLDADDTCNFTVLRHRIRMPLLRLPLFCGVRAFVCAVPIAWHCDMLCRPKREEGGQSEEHAVKWKVFPYGRRAKAQIRGSAREKR